MTAPDHLRAPLGKEPDPVVLVGRPERVRRGRLRFPVLVVNAAGEWIAIGFTEAQAGARFPDRHEIVGVPPAAANLVRLLTGDLVGQWRDVLDRERDLRDERDRLKIAIVGQLVEAKKIEAEIARLESRLSQVISDLPEDPGTYEKQQASA